MDSITNLRDYVDWVETITKNGTRQQLYFRGHYDSNYKLIPGIFRDYQIEKESYFYHEIITRCPEDFVGLSHLDRLVKMQHYGVPTRLLDITKNPLVALFFACKNYGCEKCDKSKEGEIIVLENPKKSLAYSESDTALLISSLPLLSYDEQGELLNETYAGIPKKAFKKASGNKKYLSGVVEKYYHEVCSEKPAFKRDINPQSIIEPCFVQPNKSNDRILKQDGAFIMFGLHPTENDALKKIKCFVTNRILIENRKDILKQLDTFGVNEATLFPEVDKVANYLRNH